MPRYTITCDYCGHKEDEYLYSEYDTPKCTKCKDKNTRKERKDEDKTDPFGYNYKVKGK